MRAIASAEARETTMLMGVVRSSGFYTEKNLLEMCNGPVYGRKCTHLSKQLNTMPLHPVQTPALRQLPHGNRLAGIQPSLVDPALYPVQVDGAHLHLERVVFPAAALRVGDPLRCLTTLEARRYFAVRMLTLLTASSGLSLA